MAMGSGLDLADIEFLKRECSCIDNSGPAAYTCNLEPAAVAKAEKELNEKQKDRDDAISALRLWLSLQRHIRSRTDSIHLLRYLRAAKFSQLRARAMLEAYLKTKTENKSSLQEINTRDSKLQAVLQSSMLIPLPGRDNDGCKVLIIKPGLSLFSPKLVPDVYIKALVVAGFYLAQNERTQIHGVKVMIDLSKVRRKDIGGHLLLLLDRMKQIQTKLKGCVPCRIKSIHIYSGDNLVKKTMNLVSDFMDGLPSKINKRLMCHGHLYDIYRHIPARLLPPEYLPVDYAGEKAPPISKLTEMFISDVTSEEFWKLTWWDSSSRFRLDLQKRTALSYGPQEVASYRKLSVD